ncbi:E3 ubiquitin-protein ligase itt1 [Cercospora beticola]|uniref:RBR-type E3 ubiquitin transferase n=1 Tax=Cercospora beticola TaxID=122368 RepID=A0A2G5I1J7_CERBT|nr:E3 ubiquitin-protein ligase itt1 [Cercospora beticola]PIA98650.1 E3 ubiquitin-protein ligase itt1 [Cercospora beticola]WPB00511.1 hypothetical protein RHO25_005131 [Cercospora beticola]CAK1361270.1 unnamed protein product [Cercospora beticola]
MDSSGDDEREEELDTLTAIYPELVLEQDFSATLAIPVAPATPLLVRFVPAKDAGTPNYAQAVGNSYVERDVRLSHLPPLDLHICLPKGYPSNAPPSITLTAQQDWLPKQKLKELETQAAELWDEYGQCQILFSYIDHLQQAAERGFDLSESPEGCLVLSDAFEAALVTYDNSTKLVKFNEGTYDCGVCLEPKKGSACYQMARCGHVFCKQCLQDFYNNAIKEGDVAVMRCLDPSCGKEKKQKKKSERTLHPRELLAMGIEEDKVRRYVEMKRKKKLEADKNTVYCPRTWCQGPAKSSKYPPIPADLSAYVDTMSDAESDGDEAGKDDTAADPPKKVNTTNSQPDPTDRLSVCEKCQFAFCKVCYMGWHGPFARCYPRDPNELSAEEKASYDYIRLHTTPCPYCTAPVQKTMGCNHMSCFQCRTHFCYLCSSWLDGENPYQHFNKAGSPCYQRLWELEEGDEGQGPEDGRGFNGARHWEQAAIEAARAADEEEAAAAAAQAQAEEDARGALPPVPANLPGHVDQVPIIVQMAQLGINIEDDDDDFDPAQFAAAPPPAPAPPQRGGRRQRNHFPRAPANGAAQAVRNHERQRGGGAGRNRQRQRGNPPAVNVGDQHHELDDRQQEELQRFLELARQDMEDGWDSDELGEDDHDFVIRARR